MFSFLPFISFLFSFSFVSLLLLGEGFNENRVRNRYRRCKHCKAQEMSIRQERSEHVEVGATADIATEISGNAEGNTYGGVGGDVSGGDNAVNDTATMHNIEGVEVSTVDFI